MLEGKTSNFKLKNCLKNYCHLSRFFEIHEGWIAVRLVDRTTRVDCYYSVDATEYMCSSFQFLTGNPGEYQWVRSLLGDIPHCGVRSNGLFGIGRGEVNGDTVLGKIFPPIFAMFASYHSGEHRFESYDALSRVC